MYRDVARLRNVDTHYTVRESRTGWRSLAIHPPSVQIHQFPAGFCNISTWKAWAKFEDKLHKNQVVLLTAGAFCHWRAGRTTLKFCRTPSWRLSRNGEWTKKIDQEGRLLGLPRRLVTENITSKLSENCVTASRSIDRRVRTTYGLIFPWR